MDGAVEEDLGRGEVNQQAMQDLLLHRDAGTERSTAGIVARLRVMLVEPADIAAVMGGRFIWRATYPKCPRHIREAVAGYLGISVAELIQAVESVPVGQRPIALG